MITFSSLSRAELTYSSIQAITIQATDRAPSIADTMTQTLLDLANEKIRAKLLNSAFNQNAADGKFRTTFTCDIEMPQPINSRFENTFQIRNTRNVTVWRPIEGDAKEWIIVYL